jgi:hypothetical protein
VAPSESVSTRSTVAPGTAAFAAAVTLAAVSPVSGVSSAWSPWWPPGPPPPKPSSVAVTLKLASSSTVTYDPSGF